MSNKKLRDNFVTEIKQFIQKDGYSIFLFGTWSGEYVWPKNRGEISKILEKDNIETINICDYCDLYVPVTMDPEEKKHFTDLLNEKAPEMFEEYVVSLAMEELEDYFNEMNGGTMDGTACPYIQ